MGRVSQLYYLVSILLWAWTKVIVINSELRQLGTEHALHKGLLLISPPSGDGGDFYFFSVLFKILWYNHRLIEKLEIE